jgi:hypothetical protein
MARLCKKFELFAAVMWIIDVAIFVVYFIDNFV